MREADFLVVEKSSTVSGGKAREKTDESNVVGNVVGHGCSSFETELDEGDRCCFVNGFIPVQLGLVVLLIRGVELVQRRGAARSVLLLVVLLVLVLGCWQLGVRSSVGFLRPSLNSSSKRVVDVRPVLAHGRFLWMSCSFWVIGISCGFGGLGVKHPGLV
ncbi:hypothetical protein Droror1_Dr00024566 [Drosera rotundifolia]